MSCTWHFKLCENTWPFAFGGAEKLVIPRGAVSLADLCLTFVLAEFTGIAGFAIFATSLEGTTKALLIVLVTRQIGLASFSSYHRHIGYQCTDSKVSWSTNGPVLKYKAHRLSLKPRAPPSPLPTGFTSPEQCLTPCHLHLP